MRIQSICMRVITCSYKKDLGRPLPGLRCVVILCDASTSACDAANAWPVASPAVFTAHKLRRRIRTRLPLQR